MVRVLSILALSFLISNIGFSQTEPISIQGILNTTEGEILNDIPVTLWENEDSITSTITSNTGQFIIYSEFAIDNTYSLSFDYEYQSQNDIILFEPGDSLYPQDFLIEVSLIKNELENFDNKGEIYFDKNKIDGILDADIDFIQALIKDYPKICIEFYYMGSNDEKKEFASKRIEKLTKTLDANAINKSNFTFRDDQSKVRAYQDDQRARIWISVASLNGCE